VPWVGVQADLGAALIVSRRAQFFTDDLTQVGFQVSDLDHAAQRGVDGCLIAALSL
jgi:hypothetical protein